MRYIYKKTLLIISALFLLNSFNSFSQQTAVNDSVVLDEVIVTSLNIPKKQRALAYNVQTVEGEEISKKPNADFINSLSGSTSGVLINSSSGDAGSSTFITIRGSGSISGNNQPLFVVDGFPVISGGGSSGVGGVNTSSRSIDINPNDIKSVKILKGGAASALYGVRASNGVILIETKSGKGLNKAKVEFSSTFTVDRVSQLPARQTTYAQGNNGSWIGGFSRTWGPKISELEYDGDTSYQWDPNGSLVPVGTGNGVPAVAYNPYDFFQAAPAIENHFSISNGEGNTDYYFSISNLDKEGIIPNNKFERVTARLSGGTTFKDKFKIRTNLSWTNTDETQIQKGSNVSGIMLGLLRTPPTFDNSAGYEFSDGSQRNYRNGGGYDNPYWAANNIAYERDINRVTLGTNFDYEFSDKISLSYNAEQLNFGIDFGFLGGKISGSVDAYDKITKDLLQRAPIPTSSGYGTLVINRGSMSNKGLELSLNLEAINSNDFNLSVGGNIAFNKTKIVNLGLPPADILLPFNNGGNGYSVQQRGLYYGNEISRGNSVKFPINIFIEGEENALFYGWKTDGLFQEGDEFYTINGSLAQPGDIKVLDINGDGVVDLDDRTIIGNPNPDYTYGLNVNMNYKQFSLNMLFNGVYGNDIVNANMYRFGWASRSTFRNILSDAWYNRWTPENTNTSYPRIGYDSELLPALMDNTIEDGSYLRLKNISLGYNLDVDSINFIDSAILSITGINLFTWTNYSGYDPEITSFLWDGLIQGTDWNNKPNSKTILIGLNVEL